jgi:fructokinase
MYYPNKQFLMNNKHPERILCFGEMLWDVFPGDEKIGGAPLNVAYHLNRLGLPATLVSRVGDDDRGMRILAFMKEKHLPADFIQLDSTHSTGSVLADVSNAAEVQYTIVNDVAWDHIEMHSSIYELAASSGFLVFGSLAARSATSKKTLFTLLEHPFTRILDLNLRPPFYSRELASALLGKADIVKLNMGELEILSEWLDLSGPPFDRLQKLSETLPAQIILLTMGPAGAAMMRDGRYAQVRGIPVRVANTVGSGDGFLAGFIKGLLSGWEDRRILQYGNALGALIASRDGACPCYGLQDLDELSSEFQSRKFK